MNEEFVENRWGEQAVDTLTLGYGALSPQITKGHRIRLADFKTAVEQTFFSKVDFRVIDEMR